MLYNKFIPQKSLLMKIRQRTLCLGYINGMVAQPSTHPCMTLSLQVVNDCVVSWTLCYMLSMMLATR